MTDPHPARRYRFGVFEADLATGELRRQGIRVRLNAQPFQVLSLLLERPGEVLSREQISRELWPDGTFVDYEHGVNSAVNRIREALGDKASNPRFVETLARRGYRFVAPVEPIAPCADRSDTELTGTSTAATATNELTPEVRPQRRFLASPEDLPASSHRVVQTLFILLQLMYLAFYVGALANLPEIEELLSTLPSSTGLLAGVVVSASVLIPARVFVLCAVFFQPPQVRDRILKLWPLLLVFDVLWSLSPFLLLHHISFGLALACTAVLVYSPFAQRSLVLMGADGGTHTTSATLT